MNRAELKAAAKSQIKGKIGILFIIALIIGLIIFIISSRKSKYEDLYNGIIKITYKDNIFYHKFSLPDWSLNEEDRLEDINKNNDVINENINTEDIIDKKEVLAFKEQVINNETNKKMTTIKPNISINYEDNNEALDKKKSINNNYIFLIIFILLAIILLIFDKYIHKKKN